MMDKARNKQAGEKLRRLRQVRGWSQRALADQMRVLDASLAISADVIGTWERGERTPRLDNQSVLCQIFGLSSVLDLGYLDPGPVDDCGSQVVVSELGPSLSEHSSLSSDVVSMSDRGEEGTMTMAKFDASRRTALQQITGIAGAALFGEDLSQRLYRALRKSSSIDVVTVSSLEQLATTSWRLLPEIVGVVSADLQRCVLERLHKVTELLELPQSELVYKRLCSVASELALVAGVMAAAMLDKATARSYYRLSIEAARVAENRALQAVGLARLSFLSTHAGAEQVIQSLPLVQEARRLAADHATLTTRSWLAAVEAEVLAHTGNAFACHYALDDAETITENASSMDDDPYGTTFTPFLLIGYKSVCQIQLGEDDAAQQLLASTVDARVPPSVYQQSNMLADLALIHIRHGEIEEACRRADHALLIVQQTKSASMWEYLQGVRQQLEQWRTVPAVRELDSRWPTLMLSE